MDWITINEGKTFELKSQIQDSRRLLQSIVAMANTSGGKIAIGVQDKPRRVIGVVNPLKEEERIANIIADCVAPVLLPDIEIQTIESLPVIIMTIYTSSARPHYIKSLG